MKVTTLTTHVDEFPIRCEWNSFVGLCTMWLGEHQYKMFTLGGNLRRRTSIKLNKHTLTFEFIPLQRGKLGLFILKKDGLIYKATGLSLLTLKTVPLSELPLSEW